MKNILLSIFLITSVFILKAQNLYQSTKSEISFFSEAPMENIEAKTTEAKSLLNIETKEIAFVIPIVTFHFEKPLMEEHFNENYMESDKYKTASFKGNILTDVDLTKPGTYEVEVEGELTIHGVKQQRTFKGSIEVKDEQIFVTSNFKVALKDHKIKIPKMVVKNIAEIVDVTVNVAYAKKTN